MFRSKYSLPFIENSAGDIYVGLVPHVQPVLPDDDVTQRFANYWYSLPSDISDSDWSAQKWVSLEGERFFWKHTTYGAKMWKVFTDFLRTRKLCSRWYKIKKMTGLNFLGKMRMKFWREIRVVQLPLSAIHIEDFSLIDIDYGCNVGYVMDEECQNRDVRALGYHEQRLHFVPIVAGYNGGDVRTRRAISSFALQNCTMKPSSVLSFLGRNLEDNPENLKRTA